MRSKYEIEIDMLKTIRNKEKRLTQMQMECGINYVSAANIIKGLLKEELVKKDSRGVCSLTEEGKALLLLDELLKTKRNRQNMMEIIKMLWTTLTGMAMISDMGWRIKEDGTLESTQATEE